MTAPAKALLPLSFPIQLSSPIWSDFWNKLGEIAR